MHGSEEAVLGPPAGARSSLVHRTPITHSSNQNPMANFTLTYSISKRTPASPKALKEILDVHTAVNRACTWTHERLSLAAPKEMGRAAFAFSLARYGLGSPRGRCDGRSRTCAERPR